MSKRFVVVSTEDAKKVDNFEEESFYDEWVSYLLDTKTNEIVASDGGEPEDMTLGRNLRLFVDLLNKVDQE